MKYSFIFILLILTACSSTGVIPMDSGTYMISQKSAQLGFGPPIGAKADVYKEANEFCSKTNKTVETIKLEMTNSGFARSGSVSLNFRCK